MKKTIAIALLSLMSASAIANVSVGADPKSVIIVLVDGTIIYAGSK